MVAKVWCGFTHQVSNKSTHKMVCRHTIGDWTHMYRGVRAYEYPRVVRLLHPRTSEQTPVPCARLPRRVAVSVTRDAHARTRQDAVSSWTLRAGLRRLGAPGPRRRPQVGAGRGPEPVAARLRRRRGDQAAGGGGVPRDRLLRGHPGPRRAGQPRPGGRAYLPCAHRPPRQHRELLLRSGGGREHPGPERHLRHDARRVRAPRLHRARDRRSLRSACGLQLCTAPCLPI